MVKNTLSKWLEKDDRKRFLDELKHPGGKKVTLPQGAILICDHNGIRIKDNGKEDT